MITISGETLVTYKAGINLTTHRVVHRYEASGHKAFTSIMLEDLSFCRIDFTSKPGWLILAVVFASIGVVWDATATTGDHGRFFGGLLAAGLCVAAYFSTRARAIVLAAAGGRIVVAVQSVNWEELIEFVNDVQKAKNERVMMLTTERRGAAAQDRS